MAHKISKAKSDAITPEMEEEIKRQAIQEFLAKQGGNANPEGANPTETE